MIQAITNDRRHEDVQHIRIAFLEVLANYGETPIGRKFRDDEKTLNSVGEGQETEHVAPAALKLRPPK
jgi:hypothetical protein